MSRLRIVILGAGFGGLAAANWLHRLLPRAEAEVTVVDMLPAMSVRPLLVRAMTTPDVVRAVRIDVQEALRRVGARFILAGVARIDAESRVVVLDDGTRLGYDYVVLATAHDPDWQLVPGLTSEIGGFHEDYRARHAGYQNLTWRGGEFVFLAAPPVGMETQPHDWPAYESVMILDHHLRRIGLREKTRLTLVTSREALWNMAGQKAQRLVMRLARERGVRVVTSARPVRVAQRMLEVDLPSGREQILFDRLVAIPPYRGSHVAVQSGLAGSSGWVAIDERRRHLAHPEIYAIGDIVDRPFPKTGHAAMVDARVAIHDLVHRHKGRVPPPVPAPIVLGITWLGGGMGMFVRDDTAYGGNVQQIAIGRLPAWAKSAFMYAYRRLKGDLPVMP